MQRIIASRRILAVALVASLGVALAVGDRGGTEPASAAPTSERRIAKTRRIAPGLLFTRIVDRKPRLRVFVLKVDLRQALSADVALADAALPSRRTIRAIANAADALAAVNGDYGTVRPRHPMFVDDILVQTAAQRGPLFGFRRDERGVFLGKPELSITLTEVGSGLSWPIDRWNQGAPDPGEIVAHSPIGGTLETPPDAACSVRLQPNGPETPDGDGIVQEFTVAQTGCVAGGISRDGGVIISAAPATDEATHLLAMPIGQTVRIRWSLGWNAADVVGGGPILVENGQVVARACSSAFCARNPRTAVGWTAQNRLILVVVDGRRPNWSVGASIREMAELMRDLGAVTALNLDGGGSTTMVVEGDVVNKPSDDRERSLSNAILVLPRSGPGEG